MNIICFIIEIIFIFLFFIISIFLIPIGYIIKLIDVKLSMLYATSIVRFVFVGIKILSFTKINIKKDEDIVNDEPCFYISNHRGIFDIILLYPLIKGNCIIIAKDSMKKYPFLYQWMDLIGCYFLDRNNMRSGFKMVLYSIEMLKKGVSVFIFPEGTRSKGEDYKDLLEFKEGCFSIPMKTQTSVVPIGIYDTRLIFEKNKMLSVFNHIYIHIGKKEKISLEKGNGEYFMNKVKGLF